MVIFMNYGEKIIFLRKDADITQKEMALKLNLKNNIYCMYEKEYQTIPIKYLIQIADIFNVSIDYLFGFNDIKSYNNYKKVIFSKAGTRLKEFRKDNKISQIELAAFLNTTQSIISEYEHGKHLLSTAFTYTICQKYNISADYLLGRIDSPKYLK